MKSKSKSAIKSNRESEGDGESKSESNSDSDSNSDSMQVMGSWTMQIIIYEYGALDHADHGLWVSHSGSYSILYYLVN